MFMESLKTFFLQMKDVFLNFKIVDVLDILLVALVIYAVIVQLRKTKSIQVLKGILVIALIYGLVSILGMSASSYMFSRLFNDIIIIFVILFSDEIRQALEHMGKGRISRSISLFRQEKENADVDAINAVCRACGAMSRNKVGSLILFQRNTLLGDLMTQAVMIDAQTTFEMLCSIFYPKAPLHDGAVIIRDGRIVAARCVVPMKNNREITDRVGTRHRAALEASLTSDCVAVVTSEETGVISVAVDGRLLRGMTDSELREVLGKYLLNSGDSGIRKKTGSLFGKKKAEKAEDAAPSERAEETAGTAALPDAADGSDAAEVAEEVDPASNPGKDPEAAGEAEEITEKEEDPNA